ncbi:MAG TPA: carboxypeptidase-like regulatory domain-containing protein, partial [Gemmatimonadales bacterium]|nr:carboxypeptidase-like regulatory domain-containing protein [Gemmatimonadales bacterium]
MTPRFSFLGPLALLVCLVVGVSRPASGQEGAATDIIAGTVTGPDSQPIAGATVEVTSRETQSSRQVTTDARGRFTLLFPDGGGRYDVLVRYIGMAPAHRT